MENVNVKINGNDYSVPAGSTILEACRIAGIEIPTLCYLKGINEIGACRMCVVEIDGRMIQEVEVTELFRQLDMKVKKGKEPRTIVGF